MSVTLSTTDPLEKVVAFYKKQLKEKDWELKTTTEMSQISMLDGEKEGRKLTVLISEKSDETSISLTVSKKQ